MLFLVALTVSRFHQHFGFLRPFRPLLVLTLLAGIYAYLNPRYLASGSLLRTWPAKFIGGLGIAACASVPFGLSIGASGRFILEGYSKTLLLAFLIIAAVRTSRDLYTMTWAFVAGCGFMAYLSVFVFRMSRAGTDGLLRIASGYSYDANDLATVAVVGLPLVLVAFQAARGKGRIAAGLVLIGLGMTLAKSGSRGGFLGLLGFVGAMLFMVPVISAGRKLVFITVTGISLALTAPAGYWDQMKTLLHPKQDYNWDAQSGRRKIFLRGLGYFARNPITGIGVDNFARAEGTISDIAKAWQNDPSLPGVKWSVAHNSFLEAMAEMGLPGIVLFGGLVVGGIVKTIQLRRRLPRSWVRGDPERRFLYLMALYLPVAWTTFLVAGFFVSFTYYDLPYILAALTAGLYVSVDERFRRDGSQVGEAGARVPPLELRYRGGLPPFGGSLAGRLST
jgi:O-antigen ligase